MTDQTTSASPVRHADLYHTGIVVDDIEAAKDELSVALGVTWGPEGSSERAVLLADGPRTMTFTFAYSAEGPHRLELVARSEERRVGRGRRLRLVAETV